MSSEIVAIVLFIAGQFIALLVAIVGSHIKQKLNLSELKTQNSHMSVMINGLQNDHKELGEKVEGISRHVAIIEGIEKERARNEA